MTISKIIPFLVIFLISLGWTKKQKIIVKLREPLRAETVKIHLPEVKSTHGETRDLEAKLELGPEIKSDAPKDLPDALKLNLDVRYVGTNGVQVTLTLPNPGQVEIMILDFYGKNIATLISKEMGTGIFEIPLYMLKEADHNGIKFVTLTLNGKMVLQKTLSKVR